MLWLPILPRVGPYHKPHACKSKAGGVPASHSQRSGLGTGNMTGASKPYEQFLQSVGVRATAACWIGEEDWVGRSEAAALSSWQAS